MRFSKSYMSLHSNDFATLSLSNNNNNAEHTFFVCPRWRDYREQTEETIGTLTPENVVGKMFRD